MTTTDPAAIPEEILPTCPECGATYGPAGRKPDKDIFAAWLERHDRHDLDAQAATT